MEKFGLGIFIPSGNILEDGLVSSPKDGQNLADRQGEAGAQGPLGMRPGKRRVVETMKDMLEALFQQNAELLQQSKSLHGRFDKLEDEASMRTASSGESREPVNLRTVAETTGAFRAFPLSVEAVGLGDSQGGKGKGFGLWGSGSRSRTQEVRWWKERGSVDYQEIVEEGFRRLGPVFSWSRC